MRIPVDELYEITDWPESEEDEILLLKTDQSFDVSAPLFSDEAEGTLKVKVFPAPVIVKSFPRVEVANRVEPEVTCCPVGPTAVIVPEPKVRHAPLIAKQPAPMLIPFCAVEVAVPKVRAPVMVVDALIVVDADETKPFESVRVVVVALFGNA